MATKGFCKSLVYECLLFMFDHRANHVDGCAPSVVLVVSPLITLMVNQVESLRSRGVACAITSNHEGVSLRSTWDNTGFVFVLLKLFY